MHLISLDDVLRAIASCVEIPERAMLAERVDLSGLKFDSYESDARYSKAASLLHRYMKKTSDQLHPQWQDYRDNTGSPTPSYAAREEGIALLLEQARWYWQWKGCRDKLHFRKMEAGCQIPGLNGGPRKINAGGRWTSPPTEDDYARGCPQSPHHTSRYSRLVEGIVFDFADIVAFLDRTGIPHPLLLDPLRKSVIEPSVPLVAEDAQIEAGATEPIPISTELIRHLFYQFRGDGTPEERERKWTKTFKDPPPRLKLARIGKTRQGVKAGWDPVRVASWLHTCRRCALKLLDHAFENESLDGWRSSWKTEAERLRKQPEFVG